MTTAVSFTCNRCDAKFLTFERYEEHRESCRKSEEPASVHKVLHNSKRGRVKPAPRERVDKNRCNKCKLADVVPCPIRNAAYRMHKWEGMQLCEMGDAIDKLLDRVKLDRTFLNGKDGK